MGSVSVYRVGAVGADPSYFFGAEARDSDLSRTAWLGWLPLTPVAFAGPGIALTDDTWLTVPPGRLEQPRRLVAGDVVSALDAAGELIARRDSGLTAFTTWPGDLVSDGPVGASSPGVLVADDLAAQVDRLRTAYFAVVETLDDVERGRAALGAARTGPAAGSSVRRRCGRAVRDLHEEQLRLHLLLEAAVRIGVFRPGGLVAPGRLAGGPVGSVAGPVSRSSTWSSAARPAGGVR